MELRLDRGSLRPMKRMADGRIRVDGHLTKTGVFTYTNPDGSERREYRPENEVFNEDSMSSFQLLPFTDDHPSTGYVNSLNARQLSVGMVTESIRRDGDHLAATIVVNDASVITKMHQGKVELSCGYTCDLERTPGVAPNGERYDAIQRNIRGNHVALVTVGRAGPSARVRMDAASLRHPHKDEFERAIREMSPLDFFKHVVRSQKE